MIHPRPWQRTHNDDTLPARICLYKDSNGRIFTCDAVDGYPDIYVREEHVTALETRISDVEHERDIVESEVETLRMELAAAKMVARDNSDWFNALKADFDILQTELEEAEQGYAGWRQHYVNLRNDLKAILPFAETRISELEDFFESVRKEPSPDVLVARAILEREGT